MFKNTFVICAFLSSSSGANAGFKAGKCPERPHSHVNKKRLAKEIDNLLGPWIVAVGQKSNANKTMCHG